MSGAKLLCGRQRPAPLLVLLAAALVLLWAAVPGASMLVQVQQLSQFSVTTDPMAAQSPDGANQVCMARGGTLVADYNAAAGERMTELCQSSGVGELCSFFTDGSAQPPPDNLLGCVESRPLETYPTPPNSRRCYYRWRLGVFDMVAFADPEAMPSYFHPGTCYYLYMYHLPGDATQTWNQYTYSPWNTSRDFYAYGYPRGYFQTMGGARVGQGYARMDTPVPPTENNPNPLSSFYVACTVQGLTLPISPTSTKAPQPPMRLLDDRPWAEKFWWVIFLIVAAVLLLLLLIVMCCCTDRMREAWERRRNTSVLVERTFSQREKESGASGELDEEEEEEEEEEGEVETKSRGGVSFDGPWPPQHQQPGPFLMVDPTDAPPVLPRVFSQRDVAVSSDGSSFAADQYDSSEEDDSGDEEEEGGDLYPDGDDDDDDDASSHGGVVRRVESTASMSAGGDDDDASTSTADHH